MSPIFLLLLINTGMILTIQIGRVDKACLVTTSNSTWLYGQTSTNTCICTAMQLFNSKLLALNYFSLNRSCQIFIFGINSPEINSYLNATLILLQPLPAPCCSNLTWLLTRVQRAQQPSSATVTNPTFISINSANNFLSVMSYYGPRTLLDPKNLSSIINTTSVGTYCAIASQFANLYIFSCDTPDTVRIYNETNSGLQLRYVLNVTSYPRQVVFILNNTWMLVSVQYARLIQFYSVNLTTNTFRYNQSVAIPYNIVWSLTKRNDTFIYICFWSTGTSVYTLSYNSLSWIVSNLTATQTSSTEVPTQVAIDSCGRLWVTIYGFGIRIYDTTGQTLLANWSTVSTGVDTLLILQNYEIFLGDYDNNKIDYYTPNLQCTL